MENLYWDQLLIDVCDDHIFHLFGQKISWNQYFYKSIAFISAIEATILEKIPSLITAAKKVAILSGFFSDQSLGIQLKRHGLHTSRFFLSSLYLSGYNITNVRKSLFL